MNPETTLLEELSWQQVRTLQARKPIVIIPAGAIEQHGPHLPLEVDACIAKELARAAATRIVAKVPVLVGPVLSVGFSAEHMDFSGTLSLTPSTLMAVAREIVLSLIHHGFERFVFLNGHGGNEEALKLVARTLRQEQGALIAVTSYWQLAREELKAMRETPGGGMNHGGEEETSLMLFLRPHLVNMDAAEPNPLRWRSTYLSGSYDLDPAVAYGRLRSDIAPLGQNGDPTRASPEKGERMFNGIVEAVIGFLLDFHTWRLDGMAVLEGPK